MRKELEPEVSGRSSTEVLAIQGYWPSIERREREYTCMYEWLAWGKPLIKESSSMYHYT